MHKTQYNLSAHIWAFHLLHFMLLITKPSVIWRKEVIKTKGARLWVHYIRGYVTQLKVLVKISETETSVEKPYWPEVAIYHVRTVLSELETI